jgi:hypothetical protein
MIPVVALHASPAAAGTVAAGIRFYADIKARRYSAAVIEGRRFLSAHPHDDAFAVDLGFAYLHARVPGPARALLANRDAYLRAHPAAASLWLALSYHDSEAREYQTAVADAEQFLRYQPNDKAGIAQRNAAIEQSIYAALDANDLNAARELAARYDAILAADPNARKIFAALFYATAKSGDQRGALAYGRRYRMLSPQDAAFGVDLAYAELKVGDVKAAREIAQSDEPYLRAHPDAARLWMSLAYRAADARNYALAIADADRYLAIMPSDAQAHAQRAQFAYDLWGGPHQTTYGYAYYDSRFADTFAGIDHTITLAPARGIQPYLLAHITDDTRSGAPGSPQIYADDALIVDAGLRLALSPNVMLFAAGGEGIGLRGQHAEADLRYGGTVHAQWGTPSRGLTTVDASAASYSRYGGNAIAYYDVIHTFPGPAVRPLVGINGGFDTHRVFGNRYVEGLYGLELSAGALRWRIYGVDGYYLGAGPQARYATLRAMLIAGF